MLNNLLPKLLQQHYCPQHGHRWEQLQAMIRSVWTSHQHFSCEVWKTFHQDTFLGLKLFKHLTGEVQGFKDEARS